MTMLEGTGSIGFGPTGAFEPMILASSSARSSNLAKKKDAHYGRTSSGKSMKPRVQMRATAVDITANTWYPPRRRRYNVWGGALRIPKHPEMPMWGICRHAQCRDTDFWNALGLHMVVSMSAT